MYAIILTGGKQYRVKKGDTIHVELLPQGEGEEVTFSEVLFVHDGNTAHIGKPTVNSFQVRGQVQGFDRGPKVESMKYKRRKNQRRRIGHRQDYARVTITDIQPNG